MHCREILFTLRNALYKFKTYLLTYLLTPRCSPRARAFPILVNFFLWRTVAELRGIKVAQFFGFWPIFPIQNPYNVPSGDQPTAQGLHPRMIPIFPCDSRRSKGVPSGIGDFLRLLVGGLGTPNLPKFSPMENDYTHTECNCTARQIWTNKDVWKRAILRTDVLSHQTSSLLPYSQNLPKPNFGGPFNAKPIIQIALRKSQVNGAAKVKLYTYTGIGKYLGVSKFFR